MGAIYPPDWNRVNIHICQNLVGTSPHVPISPGGHASWSLAKMTTTKSCSILSLYEVFREGNLNWWWREFNHFFFLSEKYKTFTLCFQRKAINFWSFWSEESFSFSYLSTYNEKKISKKSQRIFKHNKKKKWQSYLTVENHAYSGVAESDMEINLGSRCKVLRSSFFQSHFSSFFAR